MTDEAIPLRDYISAQMEDLANQVASLSTLTDAKFVTFRTLIDSQAEKVALALTAADKAVTKAELATEKRFESVNEFRLTLSDQTNTLASRREVQAMQEAINLRLDGISDRVTALERRIDTSEGRSRGVSASFAAIVAAIGAIVALATLVIVMTRK